MGNCVAKTLRFCVWKAAKYFSGNFLKVFHHPKLAQEKVFFHREDLQGVATLMVSETPKCGSGRVGFGGTGRKRKGPCTKQCAWRKHGSSNTRLVEACPPKLRNTVKYRVEEMRPKWPFWKHRAPKMRLVEAQCAHRKHCYPEIPLGSHPTSRVPQWLKLLGMRSHFL